MGEERMTPRKLRLWRKTAFAAMALGLVFQGTGCTVTDLVALASQIITQELASVISDTIFFLLDNLVVRAIG